MRFAETCGRISPSGTTRLAELDMHSEGVANILQKEIPVLEVSQKTEITDDRYGQSAAVAGSPRGGRQPRS